MSDKIPARFRKTKTGKWAVMAPVDDLEQALAGDGKVEVLKRSGDTSMFIVASLGRSFDVDGVQMCYGYAPGDDEEGGVAGEQPPTDQARSPQAPRRGSEPQDPARRRPLPEPPPPDQSEPLPEYRGGPDDEWQPGF